MLIVGIGDVVTAGSVATLALYIFEVRSVLFIDVAAAFSEPHRMAGQTQGIGLIAAVNQRLKRLRMIRRGPVRVPLAVAINTCNCSDVHRGGGQRAGELAADESEISEIDVSIAIQIADAADLLVVVIFLNQVKFQFFNEAL